MSNLDIAIETALNAHVGQVDKAGQPYILHPLRLMLRLTNEDERIVAVLHDVVEDSELTIDDLSLRGFSKRIVTAIDCLSKKESENYNDYISRLSDNKLATKIKIEDLRDNLDITRIESIGEKDLSRLRKYHRALMFLLESKEAAEFIK